MSVVQVPNSNPRKSGEYETAPTPCAAHQGRTSDFAAGRTDAPQQIELALTDRAQKRGDPEIRRHVPDRYADCGRFEALKQGTADRIVDAVEAHSAQCLLVGRELVEKGQGVALDQFEHAVGDGVVERGARGQSVRAEREKSTSGR